MQHRNHLLDLRKSMTRSLDEELQVLHGAPSREIARYLKNYKKEFVKYSKISDKDELIDAILKCDIIFNGDYHTLKQSQRIPIRILRDVIKKRSNIVLATEVVMMKHQRHLDDYIEGRTDKDQFLERIDYKNNWGFDWQNFLPWFDFAKKHKLKMVGLNTGKTGKNLKERDQRAAELIVGLTMLYPKHLIYTIFGDLHMAKWHLPNEVEKLLSRYKIKRRSLTIFENSETIYWLLAKEGLEEKVDVVKIRPDAFCIMNAPPWVKLQSHINWIEENAQLALQGGEEWGEEDEQSVDYSEQVHTYIQSISNYLGINGEKLDDFTLYTQDVFSFVEKLEKRKIYNKKNNKLYLSLIAQNSSFFIPGENIIYLGGLSINDVAECATKYIYSHSSNFKKYDNKIAISFLQRIYVETLGYFGSKLINHKRKCDQFKDLTIFLRKTKNSKLKIIKEKRLVARGTLFLKGRPDLIIPKYLNNNQKLIFYVANKYGSMLGEKLYRGMIDGEVSLDWIKELFYSKIDTKEKVKSQIDLLLHTLKSIKIHYKSKVENL